MGESVVLLQKDEQMESEKKLPFLSLVTFFPMGNLLGHMTMVQRQFFFESLQRMLHAASVENRKRIEALSGKILPPIAIAAVAVKRMFHPRQQEREKLQKGGTWQNDSGQQELRTDQTNIEMHLALPIIKNGRAANQMPDLIAPSLSGAHGSAQRQALQTQMSAQQQAALSDEEEKVRETFLYSIVFGHEMQHAKEAQSALAGVINDYARGDERKAGEVLSDFRHIVESEGNKSDDLMAVLLLVIEDRIWSGEEAGIGGASAAGAANRVGRAVPEKMRESMKEAAVVRLASVREMLRYYFERNPNQYASALAAALGITADQEDDVTYIQERLSYELASIGSFALAQRILAKIKEKNRMDMKDCMLHLGYRYDSKKKRLVLGKRTCASAHEVRGLLGLLIASMKK